MFLPDDVSGPPALYGSGLTSTGFYPHDRREYEIRFALLEGWHWLEINMLIMPAGGMNGNNGWKVLTRRGRAVLADENAFRSYAHASQFPKSLLHPSLGDDVWLELARIDGAANAVFKSFRAVEEAVRAAGAFRAEDVGVDLVRRAFHPNNGPLTKLTDPVAEREALSALFAGAIGSYKNPHSHRTITISDIMEAQEMVLLASHLLRIVDARRLANSLGAEK
ncbi:TIGR02391 family protein [Rhizobium hainanense]|uniref:TIGR02391 family protein n=2 Tax=Rhizobium hainanense TaxID=52131 RepID=A0A1C3WL61_9HYPH|nr:TIGR02391 family protein [Rhizobium hainanense]